MATSKSDMKGFYKQKKKSGGITKSKAKSSASSTKKSSPPKHSATYRADITQPDLEDDHDLEILRQFDMNMAYGPCIGMSRLARWERAKALGLNPPQDLEHLLKGGKAKAECLWNGRI